MAKDIGAINLLPNKGDGIVTQFLNWALSIGRLLIILTETVALSVFFFRFSLDMKIIDLHDQIKAQSFIVQSFAKSEEAFRNMQDRLTLAKKLDEESTELPQIFNDVLNMGNGRITFRTILISPDQIKIEAQAASANALSNFVDSLRQYPMVTQVNVEEVEAKTSTSMINVAVIAFIKTKTQLVPSPAAPQPLQQPVNQSQ